MRADEGGTGKYATRSAQGRVAAQRRVAQGTQQYSATAAQRNGSATAAHRSAQGGAA